MQTAFDLTKSSFPTTAGNRTSPWSISGQRHERYRASKRPDGVTRVKQAFRRRPTHSGHHAPVCMSQEEAENAKRTGGLPIRTKPRSCAVLEIWRSKCSAPCNFSSPPPSTQHRTHSAHRRLGRYPGWRTSSAPAQSIPGSPIVASMQVSPRISAEETASSDAPSLMVACGLAMRSVRSVIRINCCLARSAAQGTHLQFYILMGWSPPAGSIVLLVHGYYATRISIQTERNGSQERNTKLDTEIEEMQETEGENSGAVVAQAGYRTLQGDRAQTVYLLEQLVRQTPDASI